MVGVERRCVHFVHHSFAQLGIELVQQGVVLAQSCGVVAEIEENGDGQSVEHLNFLCVIVVQRKFAVDAFHDGCQRLGFPAVGDGERAAGRVVCVVETEETFADVVEFGIEQIGSNLLVGYPFHEYLACGSNEVIRYGAQFVCRLDVCHVAIVEEDVAHVQILSFEHISQCLDVGLKLGIRLVSEVSCAGNLVCFSEE